MVSYYDLESFMVELETLVKANIQTYMTAVNTDKGDSLLGSFQADSYSVWNLSDIQPYPMSFLQFVSGDPQVVNANPGYNHALIYPIRLMCFIQDTGDGNIGKRKARMNRVLLLLAQEKIVPTYVNLSAGITDMNSTILETEAGTTYEIASIVFTASFAF